MIAPPNAPSATGASQHGVSSRRASAAAIDSDGDSDSDWEDDDDFVSKKINIKIKPIAQMTPSKISASVDELRATVGTWKSMANINLVKPNSRRSQYQSTAQLDKLASDAADSLHLTFGNKVSLKSEHNNLEPLVSRPLQAPTRPPPPPPSSALAPMMEAFASDSVPHDELKHSHSTHEMPQMMMTMNMMQPQILDTFARASFNQGALTKEEPSYPLPVALAVQECLNVRTVFGPDSESVTNVIGHIKMAVPRRIIEMNASHFEGSVLNLQISTPRAWSVFTYNEQMVKSLTDSMQQQQQQHSHSTDDYHPLASTPLHPSNAKQMSIDMGAVYSCAKDMYRRQPGSQYFLMPELLTYSIESKRLSQQQQQQQQQSDDLEQTLNPIQPEAHWLCDLSATKVRVDLQFLEEKLTACGIAPGDVRNFKLSVQVDGGAVAQKSKPPAQWSQLDSRLIWFFNDLNELIETSTFEGVTSCLARLDLTDGPSTPGAMDVQFSIAGKTLSETHVMLLENNSGGGASPYRLAKMKCETGTGRFVCEPPVCDSNLDLSNQ